MAKRKKKKAAALRKKEERDVEEKESFLDEFRLHPDTKKSIWAVVFLGVAIVLFLASFKNAGPFGEFLYKIFNGLFGLGYYLLPLTFLVISIVFFTSDRRKIYAATFVGAVLFIISSLGFIDIIFSDKGGIIGKAVGSIEVLLGFTASLIIIVLAIIVSFLITLNLPIKFRRKENPPAGGDEDIEAIPEEEIEESEERTEISLETEESEKQNPAAEEEIKVKESFDSIAGFRLKKFAKSARAGNYIFPPLDLLRSSVEKPTGGDLRANANIIKRTLEGFGIPVEMGEVSVGPKVTRYTLKPAEGIKLSRIIALSQDLALALAAHPIRIEAPIPGKSFVGIEVPNKTAAIVRLGSLGAYPEFSASGLLGFVLGRDVTGEPVFSDIEKMPHLLIAGSTGSGKSVAIHSLIISLLYKNSPDTLRLILIDPKRVELSVYEDIPHLIAPVITESKKSMSVFKWAIKEMERRYEILLGAGSRDLKSYNKKFPDEALPFIVIIIDELADLMSTYGREVEGFIVRLAQMARATGIHLVLSTQRPSVEVITGLIKANITSRIALQVASQVDSRTILDNAGAEKLLGGGDMLFVSAELSKPRRIQGAYVSEEEIHKVADFIRENNSISDFLYGDAPTLENGENKDGFFGGVSDDEDEDELLSEAIEVVVSARKASASLLQRRLKVGYARAARLLDIMEARGIIGPGEGAKPREVYKSASEE